MTGITDRIHRNRLVGLGMIAMMAMGPALAADRPESVTAFAVAQIGEALAAGREGTLGVRRPPRDRRGDERLAWISLQGRQVREQARMVVCDLRLSPRLHVQSLKEISVAGPRWSSVNAGEPHSAP